MKSSLLTFLDYLLAVRFLIFTSRRRAAMMKQKHLISIVWQRLVLVTLALNLKKQ